MTDWESLYELASMINIIVICVICGAGCADCRGIRYCYTAVFVGDSHRNQ